MSIQKTGDWRRARVLLARLPQRGATAFRRAVLQEAHQLRKDVVQGLTSQAPGGEPIKPLSELTLAARRLRRFAGTKALIDRGDLRNSVAVLETGELIFVGVARSARSKDRTALVDVARAQEYGTEPTVIPITPAMRRYLAVLYKAAGREPSGGGSGAGVVVVQIAARPFLRPAFDRFRPGLERRLMHRVAQALRLSETAS